MVLWGLVVASAAGEQPVLAGRVLRVIDGDTLDVLLTSGRLRVRLHGVDAPERDQPGGEAARRWLSARIGGREVQLEPVSQDRYERMVALVHQDGANVNRELIAAGQAWAYRRYLRRAEREWCDVEEAARRGGSGLWAAPARAPWEFRATRGRGPFTELHAGTARDCARAIGR